MVALNLNHLDCELCGSRRIRPLWTLRFDGYPGPFRLWRCDHCGVAFNWPRLPPEAVCDQYDSNYYIFSLPPARRWSRAAQLYVEHLLPLESTAGRRLLEVGCAQGDLLALARARGWQVHGIEISPEPARKAESQHGLPVTVGTLEECGAGLRGFDVAIATDVIEHVTSPRGFLTAMRGALRSGGLAVIETPNLDGMWSRIGGRRWIGFNRFHLFLFGAGTLTRLMRSCGFRHCRATSSTHCAHSAWGERPELGSLIGLLPAGLRWRTRRGLNRFGPSRRIAGPQGGPPSSLSDALRLVERLAPDILRRRTRRLSGDNLAVTGRAWPDLGVTDVGPG